MAFTAPSATIDFLPATKHAHVGQNLIQTLPMSFGLHRTLKREKQFTRGTLQTKT
jgi:hypothetical protein